jgi:hypothetical protein
LLKPAGFAFAVRRKVRFHGVRRLLRPSLHKEKFVPVVGSAHARKVVGVVVLAVALAAVVVFAVMPRGGSVQPDIKHEVPHADGKLDKGFNAPGLDAHYSSQVIRPEPETWTHVRPDATYRVLLLATGKDAKTAYDPQVAILVNAVRKWAQAEDRVKLKVRYLHDADTFVDGIDHAAKSHRADLIITAGNSLVDPVAAVSANYAGYNPQQFLVLGAEVAEPTVNIAASDWKGSAYLGEGLDQALYYDPKAVTAPRAYAALRAGVAAILAGYTSAIVRIPADEY